MLRKLLTMGAVAVLLLPVWFAPAEAADTWRAGAASEKITPDEPMWMAGYGSRNHAATGFLNDLYAKALVLEAADGTRGVIITLDLVGIGPDVADPIVVEIERRFRLPRAAVAICCSHTHSGPVVGKNLRTLHYDLLNEEQRGQIDAYARKLHARVLAVVERAMDSLAPCKLSYGQGQATFAANRRNNKEPDVPRLREAGELAGPFDHDVPVLKVVAADGKLKAVLFGYACHATVLSEYDWSSDYPGFAQQAIEERHPECVALFFAGCGADQNPLPRRDVALARQYGQELAAAVEAVLEKPLPELSPRLTTALANVRLELAQVPTREEVEAEVSSPDKYAAARARHFLDRLQTGQVLPSSYPYPVQVWRLGDVLNFVTLGGEVVVDYALRLKQQHGADRTWVAGYANDVMAYIPSRRVLTEGGYEGGGAMVYYSLPSPWAPSVEEAIVRAVEELMPQQK